MTRRRNNKKVKITLTFPQRKQKLPLLRDAVEVTVEVHKPLFQVLTFSLQGLTSALCKIGPS